jgi:hypothetical protein
MLADLPRPLFAVPLARDMVVSETLFHELGHHLDATLGAAARGGEAAAEDWSHRLTRAYLRKRYWYLRPLIKAGGLLVAAFRRLTGRSSGPA